MGRKRVLITILIILGSLLAALSSILINVVTSQSIPISHIPVPLLWALVGIVTFAGICAAVFLYHLQTSDEQKKLTPESRNHQRMLAKVYNYWIKGVLEESLHGAVLIVLGLKEQRDAVAHPWQLVLKYLDNPERLLPPDTTIVKVYDEADGELLILGEPGSGKTTLLLELTCDLINRSKSDETLQIPVVFNLSSWALKRQPLNKWLIEELNIKYQVPLKLGQFWIEHDQVLPLLDGLDEVALAHCEACVEAINAYRREHMVSIVVCSRSNEYYSQAKRLQLHSAVTVQPLTIQQIDDYLFKVGEQLKVLHDALSRDTSLQELATNPLMLSVMTLAYHGKSVGDLSSLDSDAVRHQVFDAYIERMFKVNRAKRLYEPQQNIHWLSWLASKLIEHNQTEFYIERMQLDWLSKNLLYRLYPSVIVGLIFGLCVGFVYGLYFTFARIPYTDLLLGVRCGFLIGFLNWLLFTFLNGFVFEILGRSETNKKPEKVVWRQKIIPFIGSRVVYGLMFGLLNGFLVGWLAAMNHTMFALPSLVARQDILLGGIIYGLINCVFATLHFGALGKLDIAIQPAEIVVWSWKNPRQNVLKLFAIGLPGGLIFGGLMGLLYTGFVLQLVIGLASGLVAGLLFLFVSGLSYETLSEQNIILPNQGMRNSFRHSLVIGLVSGLISVVGIGLLLSWGGGLRVGLQSGLLFGLGIGLNFWFRSGGTACILHVILRVSLWKANFAPLNYPRFLDSAAEHILLRKVGGSYIFIHRLFLNYFASLNTTTGSLPAGKPAHLK